MWTSRDGEPFSAPVSALQTPERVYADESARNLESYSITEEVLLGGSGEYMTQDSWQVVADAVTDYVRDTKRKILGVVALGETVNCIGVKVRRSRSRIV